MHRQRSELEQLLEFLDLKPETYPWGSGFWWGGYVEAPPLLPELDLSWGLEFAIQGASQLMTHLHNTTHNQGLSFTTFGNR